jgi:hypothetical protein
MVSEVTNWTIFRTPLPRQEERATQLEIESNRASFAEASASSAVTQLNIARQRIEHLEIKVETLNHSSISRTAAERAMASDNEELRSQTASRPGRLVELYKEGKLVGCLR